MYKISTMNDNNHLWLYLIMCIMFKINEASSDLLLKITVKVSHLIVDHKYVLINKLLIYKQGYRQSDKMNFIGISRASQDA